MSDANTPKNADSSSKCTDLSKMVEKDLSSCDPIKSGHYSSKINDSQNIMEEILDREKENENATIKVQLRKDSAFKNKLNWRRGTKLEIDISKKHLSSGLSDMQKEGFGDCFAIGSNNRMPILIPFQNLDNHHIL